MRAQTGNILVLRFSAMGDVALLAPVLQSFLVAFPNYQITLATRPKFCALFQNQNRLTCFHADVDSVYKGLFGIFRLFHELKKTKPEVVLDMHDHIRSRSICFLFRLLGVPIVRFDKGRQEKKALTRKENKIRIPLPHTVERYAMAFSKAGFSFPIPTNRATAQRGDITEEKTEAWFGLAPFAAHKSKIWPLENYPALIKMIIEKMPVKFFLFGGGEKEIGFFKNLKNQFPENCVIVAGEMNLAEELALMKKLDSMICVDSSNMHLAALMGVPTISIWGGTHSHAGFGPFGNENKKKVEVPFEELGCRPCSVYGTETCHRGDFPCMAKIKPEDVLRHIVGYTYPVPNATMGST